MPINIPSREETENSLQANILSELNRIDPSITSNQVFNRSLIGILTRAFGSLLYLAYKFIRFISDQIFVSTANEENLSLHGQALGILKNQETRLQIRLTITSTAPNFISIQPNTIIVDQNGNEYVSITPLASQGVDSISEIITFESLLILSDNDIPVLNEFSFQFQDGNIIFSVQSNSLTTVEDQVREESTNQYRNRLLQEIRLLRIGGGRSEYELWAREISGITRVFVFRTRFGNGTVGIMVTQDGIRPSPPGQAKILEVYNSLITDNRPRAAEPFVFAPTIRLITVQVNINPDTVEIRNQITTTLDRYILTEGDPLSQITLANLTSQLSLIETNFLTTEFFIDGQSISINQVINLAENEIAYFNGIV